MMNTFYAINDLSLNIVVVSSDVDENWPCGSDFYFSIQNSRSNL